MTPRTDVSLLLLLAALASCASEDPLPAADPETFDERLFHAAPAESGPYVRWWWPGGAVDDPVLASELERIRALGFAGVEVQPVTIGIPEADVAADPAIRTVGTAAHLAHLKVAAEEAERRGLAFSVTLGSGWPTGGVFTVDVRPTELLYARTDATGPTTFSGALPLPTEPSYVAATNGLFDVLGPFEPPVDRVAVLAAPIVDGAAVPPILGAPIDLSATVAGDTLTWDVPSGPHAIFAVYRHRVNHRVTGGAFPGGPDAATVIDHLDPAAVSTFLDEQAGPWLDAIAPVVPDEVFVDSPELVGELPWSAGFAARFLSETGYDPTPHLPFLFREGGESKYVDLVRAGQGPAVFASEDPAIGVRAREDYEAVRARLFSDTYVAAVAAWAEQRGTTLRMQAHGGFGYQLDDYAQAGLPESEGLFAGGSTDFLELAASAAHVGGKPYATSESFVMLGTETNLDESELWMLAGRAYGAGIGRLVFHGLAYPYALSDGTAWYPFRAGSGAGAFLFTNDFEEPATRAFLPTFTRALTRVTYALTRGVDRAEVAWLLPEREIRDRVALRTGTIPPRAYESETSLALRAAGYLYDRISPGMLAGSSASAGALTVGAATYRALLLTEWPAADPAVVLAARAAAEAGVPVIVLGELPSRALGLVDAAARDADVLAHASALSALAIEVAAAAEIAPALTTAGVNPALDPAGSDCGVVTTAHREAANGHVFLVFQEDANACTAHLGLGVAAGSARLLDPETGSGADLPITAGSVTFALPAQRLRILWVRP